MNMYLVMICFSLLFLGPVSAGPRLFSDVGVRSDQSGSSGVRREPVEWAGALGRGDLVAERATATAGHESLGQAPQVVNELVGDVDFLAAALGQVPPVE